MHKTILGGLAVVAITAAACGPFSPTPTIGQPGYCGQTTDHTAVVALHVDLPSCTAQYAGEKRISVAELCGPIMPGSNVAHDCYRGNVPGRPSPDNFRLDTIQGTPGGMVLNFVASDATAP